MGGDRHYRIGEATERQFFALLRSGLWNEVPEASAFAEPVDWEALYRLSFAQTVVGHVTDGINLLPPECLPPAPETMDPFLGDTMATAQRNTLLDNFIPKLFGALRAVPAVLVKGQSLAQDYLNPPRRQPGDIDLLVLPGSYQAAKDILLPKATKVMPEDSGILHQPMFFHGVEVELHGAIPTLMSRKLDRKLARYLEEAFSRQPFPTVSIAGAFIPVPDATFNAVYLFVHLLKHYWSGGIGLRQVADWMTFLTVHKRDIHPVLLEQMLQDLGLVRLWKVFCGFTCEYLGAPAEKLPLPGAPDTWKNARIWRYIKASGNFGKNRKRVQREEPYLVRKVHSFWQLVIRDRLRHFPVFPAESLRFFLGATGYGLERLSKGE